MTIAVIEFKISLLHNFASFQNPTHRLVSSVRRRCDFALYRTTFRGRVMIGRKSLIVGAATAYLAGALAPVGAAAQDTGALIGGLAGGMIGGMIAGSMARSQGGYYRRSYAAPRSYYRPRVVKARARAPSAGAGHSGATNAAAIDSGKDPFAKASGPATTSVSSK